MKGKVWVALVGCIVGILLLIYLGIGFGLSGKLVSFNPVSARKNISWTDYARDYPNLQQPKEYRVLVENTSISMWVFESAEYNNCLSVLAHGYRSDRTVMLKYTPLLQPLGCHTALIDLRYHGKSGGEYFSWGKREAQDLKYVVDFLSKHYSVSLKDVGLIGQSLGASVILQALKNGLEVGYAVADSPFSSLHRIVKEQGEKTIRCLVACLCILLYVLGRNTLSL